MFKYNKCTCFRLRQNCRCLYELENRPVFQDRFLTLRYTVVDNISKYIFSSQLIKSMSQLRLEQNYKCEKNHAYEISGYPENRIESQERCKSEEKGNNSHAPQQRPGPAGL